MKYAIILLVASLSAGSASAWDGYDWDKGTFIEIEKGNLVRPGKDIEYYDWDKGEYREAEVISVDRQGSSVEVEVIDTESGELRTFEMDD